MPTQSNQSSYMEFLAVLPGLPQTRRWRALLSGLSVACAGLLVACEPVAPDTTADEVAVIQSELSGPAPQLSAITPNTGAATGGAKLTLTGKNFRPGTTVSVAGVEAYPVTVVSSTIITVSLPAKAGAFGRVPVVVTRPDGKSVTRTDLFYYYSDKLSMRPASEFGREGNVLRGVTADMNGDGKPDFVYVSRYERQLAVALGGTTSLLQEPKVTSTGTATPADLAVADFNGDKNLDVVVGIPYASGAPTAGSILLFAGKGDGTFAAPQTVATAVPVNRLFVQDLNRDGKLDLFSAGLVEELFFDEKAYYQFLPGKGDGTFEAAKPLALPNAEFTDVFLTDTDGDGKTDLLRVSTSPQEVRTFLGKGDGTFADGFLGSALSGLVTYSPELVLGDVNGDGKADLLVERTTTPALYLAKGDGTFALPITVGDSLVRYGFALGDIDGDGKLDLFSGNQPAAYFIGKGDGTFGPRQAVSTRGFTATFLVDLNGDKRAELIGGSTLEVLANNNGTFLDPQSIATGSKPSAVRLGDVNGDGKSDMVITSYDKGNVQVALGEGNGRFGVARSFTTGTGPSAVVIADVSGDGKADLVVSNFDSNNVSVLLGNGDGTFATPRNFAVGNSPGDVVVADVNADGKLDVATCNYDSDNVSVLVGSGGGSFLAAKTYVVQKFPTALASGDLNGDGKADLVVANSESNSVSVLLASATGFSAAKHTPVGKNPLAVVVSDLNGDGKQDIAAISSDDNLVSILINSGTGTLAAATPLSVCTFPSDLAAADLDGDGRSDLAVSCAGSHYIDYWLGFGDGAFFPAQSRENTWDTTQIALGDTNGDGKTDLVYVGEMLERGASLINKSP